MQLLASWLSLSVALWVTALLVPGFRLNGIRGALVVGAVLGVLSWALGKALFVLIGFATLFVGFIFAFITRWIVMAILLKLTDALTESLSIAGFGTALVASAVLSIVGTIGQWLFH
jgi:putative membrane protein